MIQKIVYIDIHQYKLILNDIFRLSIFEMQIILTFLAYLQKIFENFSVFMSFFARKGIS
jgi:hypothetical protein